MKSRKNYIAFAAGMATMVLLASLLSMSLAKEDRPDVSGGQRVQGVSGQLTGQVAYGEAGIALFGVEQAAPGEALITAKGAKVPLVLTYTDEKGEAHYFVEAGAAAELLDVQYGAHYHEALNCVDFGADCLRDEQGEPRLVETFPDADGEAVMAEHWSTGEPRHDFKIVQTQVNGGKRIGITRDTPIQSGDISISVSSGTPRTADMPEELQKELLEMEEQRWAERIKETPLKPEYGKTLGMFTEVDPAEIDTGSFSGASMNRETLRNDGEEGVEHTFAFTPLLGEYAAITIENPGKAELWVMIRRNHTVGSGFEGSFTTVRVPAGQKITRAFRIDGQLSLENQLTVQARAMAAGASTQVILTAEQYRAGVRK